MGQDIARTHSKTEAWYNPSESSVVGFFCFVLSFAILNRKGRKFQSTRKGLAQAFHQ